MVGVMAVDQRRLEMYRDDRGKRIMEKVLCLGPLVDRESGTI